MRKLRRDDPHGLGGHQELERGNAGRHQIVLSSRNEDGQVSYFIHIRPVSRPDVTSLRFRDGQALALMGFTARPACPLYPLACAFAGCYYLQISGTGDDKSQASYVVDRLCQDLEGATDKILDGIRLALDLNLPIRTP